MAKCLDCDNETDSPLRLCEVCVQKIKDEIDLLHNDFTNFEWPCCGKRFRVIVTDEGG